MSCAVYSFRGVCGFSGLNTALSVALKQRWPDRPLLCQSSYISIIKLKHIPSTVFGVALIFFFVARVL